MKRILAHVLIALALGVSVVGVAQAAGPDQSAVVTTQDSNGQMVVIALDGASEVLLEYGDPDSGIGGNRGDSAGTSAASAGDVSGLGHVPHDLFEMLMACLLQWQGPLR